MIVQSILDNDLYKFSMAYSYMKLYPEAEGRFEFFDRGKTEYTEEFVRQLQSALYDLSTLKLTQKEFNWAVGSRIGEYIPQHFWEWLKGFQFDYNKILVFLDDEKHLHIEVTDKMYKVTFYEVPILAIVSELRGEMLGHTVDMEAMLARLDEKIELANNEGLKFSEFGTRRRFSFDVQDAVVKRLVEKSKTCVGTSNVYLGMVYGTSVLGSIAHEMFMFHASIFGYSEANHKTLEDWVETYDGDLGIALTDTFTSKVFFDNFSRKHAKLFDGVRHDSGDPYQYVDMAIERYKKFNIDPTTKTVLFSNALTMPEYKKLADYCKGKIRYSAGIGTNLTNDTGNPPANIVMKLMGCRLNPRKAWKKCIKISDDLGKHMGNNEEFELAKKTLGL